MGLRDALRLETTAGAPVRVGDTTVTPLARSLVVRLRSAALVWSAPAAVLVERDGRVQRIAVHDVTRVVQLGLLAVGLSCAIAGVRLSRRKERLA